MFKIVTCPPLPDLPNGRVWYRVDPVDGRYPFETDAYLLCNEGFRLSGNWNHAAWYCWSYGWVRTYRTTTRYQDELPTCRGNIRGFCDKQNLTALSIMINKFWKNKFT